MFLLGKRQAGNAWRTQQSLNAMFLGTLEAGVPATDLIASSRGFAAAIASSVPNTTVAAAASPFCASAAVVRSLPFLFVTGSLPAVAALPPCLVGCVWSTNSFSGR